MDADAFLGALRGPQATQTTLEDVPELKSEILVPGEYYQDGEPEVLFQTTLGEPPAEHPALEPVVLFPETEEEGLPAAPEPEPVAEEQERVTRDVAPSGIVLEYRPAQEVNGKKLPRIYRVNGVEVPSVTSVLGVLEKPGLPWWGMRVGIAGTLMLVDQEILKPKLNPETFRAYFEEGADVVEDLLTEYKLTVNHVKEQAGDRGSSVHDAFETWALTGKFPDPLEFPEAERGYVQGLLWFLTTSKAEALATEVMVGSAEHGFAGRYDIRLKIPEDVQLVVHLTPKGQREDIIPAGVHLSDLKTSKGVYPNTHFRQLEAYEAASIECGYQPTDARYVIHVTADGRYEYKRSTADFEDFLAVLEVWHSNERLKGSK